MQRKRYSRVNPFSFIKNLVTKEGSKVASPAVVFADLSN